MNTLFDQDFFSQHAALQKTFHSHCRKNPSSTKTYTAFQDIIGHYYMNKKRDFSWRTNISPYRIVVSEIMLQQTQTTRVAEKFDAFIATFPSFRSLAEAPFHEVLRLWKGLGYNRRAQALQKIALFVCNDFNGTLPSDPIILQTFPGIGKATARSIVTFAFNLPSVFIETNIRTVFIYFFFANQHMITDQQIEPHVAATVNQINPREWYYALMDYGVMLKKMVGNVSRLSAHHHKQSKFEGSERQVRGQILQQLLDQPHGLGSDELTKLLHQDPILIDKLIQALCHEQLITYKNNKLVIT